MVFIITRLWTFSGTTTTAFVGSFVTNSRITSSLLAKQLFGTARNFAPAEGAMSTSALVGKVHKHNIVKKLFFNFATKISRVDAFATNLLALFIKDIYC